MIKEPLLPRRAFLPHGTRTIGLRSLEREVVAFVLVGLMLIVAAVYSALAPQLKSSGGAKTGALRRPGARKKDLAQVRESFQDGTYSKQPAYFVQDPSTGSSTRTRSARGSGEGGEGS